MVKILSKSREKNKSKEILTILTNSYKIMHEKLIESNKRIKELKAELKREKISKVHIGDQHEFR